MGSFEVNLNKLSEQVKTLKTKGPQRNQVLGEVVGAIYELSKQLREQHPAPEEWIKIYDIISEYSNINLTPEENRLFDTVKRVFIESIYGAPKTIVQTMLHRIEHERAQSIAEYGLAEQTMAKNQWCSYFLSGSVDAADIRGVILSKRAEMPRMILSLSDEIALIGHVIDELHPSAQSAEIERFKKGLNPELFSLKNSLAAAENQGKKEKGVLLLESNPRNLSFDAINRLRVARFYRLMDLQAIYNASIKDSHRQVATKFFPATYGWFVGGFEGLPSFSLIEIEMQKIARENGMKVVGDHRTNADMVPLEITDEYKLDVMLDGLSIAKAERIEVLGPYVQDIVDFSVNGEVRVPRMKHHMEEQTFIGEISEKILDYRKERSPEWKEIIDLQHADPEVQGAVFMNNLALKAIALADSLGCQPVMNLTYNEGGNTLIGQRGSDAYVIIGLDSYAISKAYMEKDLGRSVSDKEVRLSFAIDYGVLVENVYFIEQPGDFHLDMSMAIVGENTIIMNDSVMAHEMFFAEQHKWLAEFIAAYPDNAPYMQDKVERVREESIARKRMEDIAARQLEGFGFNVVRVPGKFQYTSQHAAMNLFNMVTAHTPEGKNIVVMLGCINQTYQDMFADVIRRNCDKRIDDFYFLDLQSSQESLSGFGGVSCRTKTIPH